MVGLGAVGTRAARQLLAGDDVESLTVVHHRPADVGAVVDSLGPRVRVQQGGPAVLPEGADVVIFTMPVGLRRGVEAALERGAHAVATTDDPAEVRSVLSLDTEGR